jgi:hyperosmotically inducible protein
MKRHVFPGLSLATLLVACAHDPANHQAGSVANAEQRAESRSESDPSRDGPERTADQSVEPVDVQQPRADRDRVPDNDGRSPAVASGGAREPNAGYAADNTGVNERDRDRAQPTPMDQGNGEVDVDLTQRIRKAVMADDSLSFTAKNAKIITRDGRVTLRGPVKSAAEKDAIYKCAVSAAGVGRVTNELEVSAK